jgi:hypothetical protein
MATYWHPLLAQFLREDYGDRLEVKDSVKIGKMPTGSVTFGIRYSNLPNCSDGRTPVSFQLSW